MNLTTEPFISTLDGDSPLPPRLEMSVSAPTCQILMQIVHHRNAYSAAGRHPTITSWLHQKKTAIMTKSSRGVGTSNRVPTKEDFDWLYSEMTGFMRTQVLAVAASLRLAEHLQDGGRTAEDFSAFSGPEPSMAFCFLRACTKIGLTACDDGRTFKSTSRRATSIC